MAIFISKEAPFVYTQHAAWACHPLRSKGRRFEEAVDPTRGVFQRDRDRIVHSSAFRRLVYKTQVFLNHEGDLFRTRLTHSLEVAQLGRSLARALGLDEDLVEALALAHDLGHTPFGHAGQDALDACMQDYGGFEHNMQSLRIVDVLEQRYPQFDGLNLCFETREGILKHCSKARAQVVEQHEPNGVAKRFLDKTQPSMEAQLCNLADSIAYNAHDVDDGLRSGLLLWEQVVEVPIVQQHSATVLADYPKLHGRRLWQETMRRMLADQIADVVVTTHKNLAQHQPNSVEAVRQCPPLVTFSGDMHQQTKALKGFLHKSLYRNPKVDKSMISAQQIVRDLFDHYHQNPSTLPEEYASQPKRERAIADYIAGMTDRYALREHFTYTGKHIFSHEL